MRFKRPDDWVPGPGQYVNKNALSSKASASVDINASFKSSTQRDLKFVTDKDIPGSGQYNTQQFKAIGVHHITGGAPNNFLILARANNG
jgi:hypothetical protein